MGTPACELPVFAAAAFRHDAVGPTMNSPAAPFFSPFRALLRGWLLSFLGWGILAFGLGSHFVSATGVSASDAVQVSLRNWLPWAILTPLLIRLVARLPLDRGRLKIALPVHLACLLATMAACEVWSNAMRRDFGQPWPMPRRIEGEPLPRANWPPPGDRGGSPPPPFPSPGRLDVFRIVASRLPIYLAIISAAHALLFFRRVQERERRALGLEASLAKARLEALKMQLQPHFLFNSLNAIAELVHAQPTAAEEMLVNLSDLLRLTLSTSGEQELPLSRELEFVEHYLAIEHVRYGDRLRFELDVAPDTTIALVPAFLLQPLVENAVRHGLEPHPTAGLLTIRVRREDDLLRLIVADNGVGFPAGQTPREGIGLGNTRARLRELYGDAAQLRMRNGGGVSVEISIPFRSAA
jgi:signal transduction histidine kinase